MKWVQCKYDIAQQYRYRILTGSIGLESKWSEWITGKKLERAGLQCQYRCRENDYFLELI